jgi:glycosyltransferase involved in cell wall biosynthesis
MHRHFDYPEVTANHERPYRDLTIINMIAKAKCIFAESNAGKEDIIRHYGGFISADKLKVVDILPCDYLQSSSFAACSLREELTELGKKRFFLYPAQYWAHKCHKTLILAASLLKQQGITDFRLVFTGSYSDRHRATNYISLLELVEEHNVSDIVQFLGFVEKQELDFLYRNALCLLMPSAFGPTNLPPLEALMRGCPVVASRAYGMSEFLPFGVPLIDSSQVESWCNQMKLFLNDYRYKSAVYLEQSKNLQTRSLKNAVRQFSGVLEMLMVD